MPPKEEFRSSSRTSFGSASTIFRISLFAQRWNSKWCTSKEEFILIKIMSSPTPDLRYPIGRFQYQEEHSPQQRSAHILAIENTPARLREVVRGLTDQQLDTPYREGGWS